VRAAAATVLWLTAADSSTQVHTHRNQVAALFLQPGMALRRPVDWNALAVSWNALRQCFWPVVGSAVGLQTVPVGTASVGLA
jgi:hypothetical protein